MKNILIIGAGEAGIMVANEICKHNILKSSYNLIGFLDDFKKGKIFDNYEVLGKISQVKRIIKNNDVNELIIAIPSANKNEINKIIKNILSFRENQIDIKIVPGIYEIIKGSVNLNQIRDINMVDFLGREEVEFNIDNLSNYFKDKKVLVTGAGGSIGSEIINQLLLLNCKKIYILGHGENSLFNIIVDNEFNNKLDYVIADVRDKEKINSVMNTLKPNIVFHAAANKHVPFMEKYPDESVKTNIIGTNNVVQASLDNSVSRFIFVSTDKAVEPTSIMGMCKNISEKIVLSYNQFNKTVFSITRFGNVLGSRGSIIPKFIHQIKNIGKITITHPNMERYFMSIREAARLVIQSSTVDKGNVFVLDMGKPIKILNLAKKVIMLYGNNKNIDIEYIGIRQGEKLSEKLFNKDEFLIKTKFNKLLVSKNNKKYLNIDEIDYILNDLYQNIRNFDKLKKILKKYSK